MVKAHIQLGIDRLLTDSQQALVGKRFGVLVNQASVTSDYRYTVDALSEAFPVGLAAIFSPQHGLWGEQQANMIETSDGFERRRSVPIHSLYGDVRWPTDAMLDGLDCLVIDLQDVGTRVYTYIWTLSYCLEACAKNGLEVLVLDRPNPLGGEVIEGPILQKGFESFVGRYSIPMRHGLTIGEFARYANSHHQINAKLNVIKMSGWQRAMMHDDTDLPWIPPSPNMPRFETACLYPGLVMLEGTNLSEGRGTTRPFEIVGAPFVDAEQFAADLAGLELTGVKVLPIRFEPTFDKWKQESCGGAALYLTDPKQVRSYELATAMIACARRRWPNEFAWLPPPYEYEKEKMPIDILSGSPQLRTEIDRGTSVESVIAGSSEVDGDAWIESRDLLYE